MNQTLEYYNKQAEQFSERTKHADISDIRDKFLAQLPVGANILDLGCGSGRDALVFLQNGYQVKAIDGSKNLCELASKYIGQKVICQRFEEISFVNEFDGIWACASLLHLPLEDLKHVLTCINAALKENGILYMSFKYGASEGMRNGRFFTDMNENRLQGLKQELNLFNEVETWMTSDVRTDRGEEKWMNVLWRKH